MTGVDMDVERWLLDVALANREVDRARRRLVRSSGTRRRVEPHVRRLLGDTEYSHLIAALADRARQWAGSYSEFLAMTTELDRLEDGVRPLKRRGLDVPGRERSNRLALIRWANDLESAPARLARLEVLERALRNLTGSTTDDEAERIAFELAPIVGWPDLEAAAFLAERSQIDLTWFPPAHSGSELRETLSGLNRGRVELARRALQHSLDSSSVLEARQKLYDIASGTPFGGYRVNPHRPTVAELLTASGHQPASAGTAEQADQVQDAIESSPEAIRDYLGRVRASAERLIRLTGAQGLAAAVVSATDELQRAGFAVHEPGGREVSLNVAQTPSGRLTIVCSLGGPESRPDVEMAWSRLLVAHPYHYVLGRRGRLPNRPEPGCLYIADLRGRQITAVFADSLTQAWAELDTTELNARREKAIWVSGDRDAIRRASPFFEKPASALKRGRPITVTSHEEWAKAPSSAGIYRIHRTSEDGALEVYVGRSQNLARRPRWHEKLDGLPWGAVTGGLVKVELIPAKAAGPRGIWTFADLDEAEERHIARMRRRADAEGFRVINSTVGRNGPPSKPPTHLYVWQPSDPTLSLQSDL